MSLKRTWLYAVVLFVLVGAILATQVSWILKSAKIEESFLNQRVNMALCSAMDVLSKDRGLCSNVESCSSHGNGKFEITFSSREKSKIDSVIEGHLAFYNVHVPFQTTLSSYKADSLGQPLPLSQALMFPKKSEGQNVLVNIDIPSQGELVRAQINTTFLLSILVLALLIGIFISTVRALVKEKKIRSRTVDFINTMAHDLKTPISNISFAAALLNRNGEVVSPAMQQYLSIVEMEASRLKERTAKILGIASVDAVLDKGTDKRRIDIHQVIADVVDSFKLKLEEKKSAVETDLNASKHHVFGSKLQLSSAISNIIDNAILYSDTGSVVRVKTVNDGGGLRVEIEDNGPGIPANEHQLVFQKAYRGHAKQMPEGFGLGLYIARTSIERNGGNLSLTSDGSSGSNFIITLPALL